MWFAVCIAVLAVALGAALTFVSASSPRVLGPLRTFATFAALSVVIAHLLPESLEALGARALAAFVIALMVPELLHRFAERSARKSDPPRASSGDRLGLEASYAGLVAHHVGDGAGIGAYSAMPGGVPAQLDVIVALVAHTMPLVAVIALAYQAAFGTRAAALRIAGLALASVVGVILTFVVPLERIEAINAWVAAVASGLLLHVVTHDLKSDPPESLGARAIDLAAVAAGLAIAGLGAGHAPAHTAEPHFHERAYALLLKAAPPLAAGLAAALLLRAASKRIELPKPSAPGAFTDAVLGATDALLRPGSARGQGLLGRLAYRLAAPVLGLEVLALTVGLFGIEFAALRFAGALLVALVVPLVLAAFPGGPTSGAALAAESHSFENRFDHVAVAVLVGVIAGALLDTYLAPGVLLVWSGSPLELASASLIATVAGAPAAPLVVPLWVLVQKGLSPGAALIALLSGPLFGLGSLRALTASLGAIRTALAVIWTVSLAWLLAFVQSRHGALAPLFESRRSPEGVLEIVSQVALALLGLFVLRRVFAIGARTWLTALSIRW